MKAIDIYNGMHATIENLTKLYTVVRKWIIIQLITGIILLIVGFPTVFRIVGINIYGKSFTQIVNIKELIIGLIAIVVLMILYLRLYKKNIYNMKEDITQYKELLNN